MPENLYRRGRTWWLRTAVGGRELRRSLQTSDKAEARERAKGILKQLNRQRWGDERHRWVDAAGRWLAGAAAHHSASTIQRYLVSMKQAAAILEPLYLDEIDRKALARIAHRPGITNATRRRDLTAISAVLRAAVSWGWLESNPAREFDRSAVRERRDPIVLPQEGDVERFITACGAQLGPLVRLLEQTGLRLMEAGRLQWSHVDLRRRALTIERAKGGRTRQVPLSDAALGTISGTVRRLDCPWVFWRDHEGKPGPWVELDHKLAKIRSRIGVPFRTHDLRHLFAVRFLRDGGSIYELQQRLGHTTIKTTELYLAYLTPEEAVAAKRLARCRNLEIGDVRAE